MYTIEEAYKDTYPKLAKQLEELGIKTTTQLKKRFESNGKYVSEVLDYDLKDNEKIRSIAESPTPLNKKTFIGGAITLSFIVGLPLYLFYKLMKWIYWH